MGDGLSRWTAVHRIDDAHLFRLALEKGGTGARYHGIAEEGVPDASRAPEEATILPELKNLEKRVKSLLQQRPACTDGDAR